MGDETTAADINHWFFVHVHSELTARGWSARELARRAGCSASTFTRVKQRRGIALAVAARIADALGEPLAAMVAPFDCPTCHGGPPAGFACLACGAEGHP